MGFAVGDRPPCGRSRIAWRFGAGADRGDGPASTAIHTDAVHKGNRVLLIDDLLATGGTAQAAAQLVKKVGAEILEITFLIELTFLKGRDKLKGLPVRSLISF